MYSCRQSVQVCPVFVRNWIAVIHSSVVGSISFTAAWRCRTITAITSASRASVALAFRAITTSALFSSVK